MAYVSGGGGGGLPPQTPQSQSSLGGLAGGNQQQQQQLLESLLLQQQAAAASQANPLSLLTSVLLQGQLGAGGAGAAAMSQQQQQSQQSLSQLQQLQNQLALQQLMNQNGGQLNALANPSLGLYYQLLQQQQQQQQQTLLQQLQAQQQQQAQQQAQQHQQHQQHQQQQHVQPQASVQQPLQISSQSHSAFQPPQQGSSSGSVESQMNAQERLLALLNEQQGHSGAMGLSAKQELEQRMMMQNNPAAVDRAVPRNSKEVHDRINKLISDNEAIIQPQEPLLKRRPYHRQVGQQSSMDDSNSSSTRTSPGIRDVRMLQASSRTQSLYEPLNGARAFGGSLTSGQPVIRQQQIAPTCPYCLVPFPNEAGLQCHQQRCSKRIEVEKANETALAAAAAAALAPIAEEPSSSRHPLKRRLLAAVAAEQETATSPSVSKLARKDSGDCIVVGETRAPERKESMGFEAYIHPGLPRRATIAAIPTQREPVHLPQPQPVAPVAPVAQQPQAALISPQAQQHLHQQAAQTAQSSSFAQMLQRCGYQAPQTQAYPIPPQANQAQAASTSAAPAPIPAPLQMQNGQAAAVTPTSIETQVQQQMRRIEVDQQSLSKCDGSVSKPYTLMLSEPVKTNPERNVRNRGRNITSEAFVCLTRPQPMFVEQKGNLSMYSNWHQVQVNEADAKLNLQFMGMCSPKPRTGVHSFWRYTVANRDMVQYKVTHSSFWDISRKLKQRQEEEAAREQQEEPAAIKIEDVDLAIVKEEPCSSYALRDEIKQENGIEAMVKEEEDEDFEMKPERSPKPLKKPEPLMGGHRTDEVYVYVRGRGRGRYVCDRCGIRCKKPSMLKKHIKSHTDVRPYKCKKCNFSFKTKGNLTKHLGSKTHRRRLMQGDLDESDSEDRLEIATPDEDRDAVAEVPDRLDDDDLSDEEDNIAPLPADMMEIPFRRFGQEQILFERTAHTPPSRWVMCGETTADDWPEVTRERDCSSAPPVAIAGPNFPDKKIISPVAAPMAIQFTQPEPSPAAGFSQTNGIGSGHARFNGAAALQNNMVYSFLPKEEGLKCDQCDKTFRKQAELTYHQMTHNVEKQQLNSKNRMFQCPECRHLTRTKASLAKHMETTHGSHMDESAMASIDPSASTQSVLGGGTTQVVNNPRSFMCNDCNIGFRKHGILAKHLRSKTHVTKLETLKRLPEDSLSLIQSRDNGACLNEVDTTDCEKARASLTAIVEAIREENKRATAPAAAVPPAAAQPSAAPAALPHPVPQPSSSLECREQLTSSPMPAVPVANNRTVTEIPSNGVIHMPRASYSETSTPFRSRCGSAASINTETPRKRSDSIISKLDPNHLQAMKLVSANVWVPPRPVIDQAQISRPDSATITRPVEIMAAEPMETTRSSCSSPVMRILAANGHRSPPLPTTTKCTVCHTIFDTPVDLQVHLYTDHISVKDGTFFKCPKKFCDKVYPNKDCLRTHVMAHYRSEINDLREDESLSSHASLVARGALLDDLEQRSTPMTDGSDSSCHSPVVMDVPRSLPSVESRPEELRLPCNFCDRIFSDAMSLQQHWFQDHTNRGHVCQLCDAGFTTQEALQHHVASHNQQSTNGVR